MFEIGEAVYYVEEGSSLFNTICQLENSELELFTLEVKYSVCHCNESFTSTNYFAGWVGPLPVDMNCCGWVWGDTKVLRVPT
jgi:hypothetical protein